MTEKRAVEAALHRRYGMSQEQREVMAQVNALATDWYATCPKCGTILEGRLTTIREHKCAPST